MITVWILIFYMGTVSGGGPAVIDNIASKEECVRLQEIVMKLDRTRDVDCIETRKVSQQ